MKSLYLLDKARSESFFEWQFWEKDELIGIQVRVIGQLAMQYCHMDKRWYCAKGWKAIEKKRLT